MRIKLATATSGGPLSWGLALADGLRQRGYEVDHVSSRPAMLFKLLYQGGVDVVHTTIPFPLRKWRSPLVVTVKGDFTIEQSIVHRFYPRLIAQADVVTTPSEYMKAKIEVPEAVVIPNAVWPEGSKVIQYREKVRLNIATVMNFYFEGKAKGMVHLCDIMEKAGLPPFRHIVVGDGPFCATAREAAKVPGLDIRFSGFLLEPRMVLGFSDIFLYYSFHDNQPNVILEAMAHGLPVITNRVGAVAEIIENGVDGYVAQDDAEYVDILHRLMGDVELRQKVGSAARRSVEEKFNWSTIVDRYVEIYEGLCK